MPTPVRPRRARTPPTRKSPRPTTAATSPAAPAPPTAAPPPTGTRRAGRPPRHARTRGWAATTSPCRQPAADAPITPPRPAASPYTITRGSQRGYAMADTDGGDEGQVLVVEDDPEINELVGAYVQLAGYEYASALNGTVALRKASEHRPALVVLDVMLPDIDGFE